MDPSFHTNSYLSDEEEDNLMIDEGVDTEKSTEKIVDDLTDETKTCDEKRTLHSETLSKTYLQIQEQPSGTKKHPLKSLEKVVNSIIDRNFKQENTSVDALKSPVTMTSEVSSVSTSASANQVEVEKLSPANSAEVKPLKIESSVVNKESIKRNSTPQESVVKPEAAKKSVAKGQKVSPPHPPVVSQYPWVSYPYGMMNTAHSMHALAGNMMTAAIPGNTVTSAQQNRLYGSPYDFTSRALFAHGYRSKVSPTAVKGI